MAKKHELVPTVLYMVIDVTTSEPKLLYVTDSRRATQRGFLLKAQGRKVIAPPMEGRGFAKLDLLGLQYLHWGFYQRTPPEDYRQLVQECLDAIKAYPVDEASLESLEAEVSKTCPDIAAGLPYVPQEPKDPNAPPVRPKARSTTGLVWEIADELLVKNNNEIPNRKDVISACVEEGINEATASTQFSKWKSSKLKS